jgi:hypothetical protein
LKEGGVHARQHEYSVGCARGTRFDGWVNLDQRSGAVLGKKTLWGLAARCGVRKWESCCNVAIGNARIDCTLLALSEWHR